MLSRAVLVGLFTATAVLGEGFEVVIKYVRPTDGSCTCPSGNDVFPTLAIGPGSGEEANPTYEDATPTYEDASPAYTASPSETIHDGPMNTIKPAVHWSCDTTDVNNIVPRPVSSASPMYYGSPDPKQEGYYGWLTYHFSTPAVNLDESDYVSCEYQKDSSDLHMKFSSQEAFDLACDHWNADDGLVLVAYVDGCGEDHDRCYFKVTGLDIQSGELVIVASGTSRDPHDLIDQASTEFGWWVPGRTKGARPQPGGSYGGHYGGGSAGSHGGSDNSGSGSNGGSAATQTFSVTVGPASSTPSSISGSSGSGSTGTASPSGSSSSGSSGSGGSSSSTGSGQFSNSTSASGNTTTSGTFADNTTACTPPVDDVYGLPTACLTEYFDEDLDDMQGYSGISNGPFQKFVQTLAPDTDNDVAATDSDVPLTNSDGPTVRRRWNPLKAIVNLLPAPIRNPVNNVINKIQTATSISGSINKSLSFKLPDPKSSDPAAKTPKDSSLKQTQSPWGDAILLKSFGDSQKFDAAGKAGYLNVYCVDCGVEGNVKVAGRAAWTPIGMEFTEGQLELHTDIKMVLKLGVDAKIKFTKDFKNTILDYGLPGLSYGIITIGPRVSVASSVTFNAAAEGKLLAGAEMGIADGMVVLDWVNFGNSKSQGWEPYFNPVFQADGQINLSAELGLPVSIACGVKISSWDKSLSITDTPSLKATAQISGSAGLGDNGVSGTISSGDDNCPGIATSISWRNRIDVDIFGAWGKPLYDTNDRILKKGCIKLTSGSNAASTTTDSTASTTTGSTGSTDTSNTGNADTGSTGSTGNTDTGNTGNTDTGSTGSTGNTDTGSTGNADTGSTGSTGNTDTGGTGNADTGSTGSAGNADTSNTGSTGNTNTGNIDNPNAGSADGGNAGNAGNIDAENSGGAEAAVQKRAFRGTNRFAARDNTTAATNATVAADGTSAAADTVVDMTLKVKGATDFSYTPTDIKPSGYNQTDGYDLSLMVDPDVTTMLVSCGNGNVYLSSINVTDMTYCTELFASYKDLLVQDGASRYLHYYNNTMAKTGVSRLRVATGDDMPNEGVLVVMVPYDAPSNGTAATSTTDDTDGDDTIDDNTDASGGFDPDSAGYDSYSYYAVDAYKRLFYPAVCTYADGSMPRMFLVQDPVKGPQRLMEAALQHTVTGGEVDWCDVMTFVEAKYDDDNDYVNAGDDKDVVLDYDDE